MRVLLAAHNDGIGSNENSQHTGQHTLHGDENHSSDCLCCLCNAEFLNEDENADHGKSSDHLDKDVDDVARFSLVWPIPDQEAKHYIYVREWYYEKVEAHLLRHSIISCATVWVSPCPSAAANTQPFANI